MYTYTYVLEILNSVTGTLIEEIENNIMNIPAELVMVANQCDINGLREEADILTNIAKVLMSQDSGNQQIEQPQENEWEKQRRLRPDVIPYNQTPISEENENSMTDYMGR